MIKNNPLIVALDVETFDEAKKLIDLLSPAVDIFKVGSQLFTSLGPEIIDFLIDRNKKIFLDLKYHDIPNTVANSVAAAVNLNAKSKNKSAGIVMMTVHTLGGEEMLKKAVEAAALKARSLDIPKPYILGITVLTSDESRDNIPAIVIERAKLAQKSGLDGVVASSLEAAHIRQELGKKFIIVTPGIRPAGSDPGDQKRITTPRDAIRSGSSFLVVGRPILKAPDPLKAVQDIIKEIS